MKEFTKDELKKYNGENGQPAYVAMGGKVYDVSGSKMWKQGQHMRRHSAGNDLTEDFTQAPHGEDVLERVQQVGVLKGASAAAQSSGDVPAWARLLLDFHPHPIAVHFPQAFLTFAPIFLILFYITGNAHLERTAFYMLLTGALMSIPTVVTGFFHWIYKYAKSNGGIYYFKIGMSFVVMILAWVVVALHASKAPLPREPKDTTLLVLYVLLMPVIATIGHAGGIIVFGGKKK